jgi:hypothetical protein
MPSSKAVWSVLLFVALVASVSAQSQLDPALAQFAGNWTVALESPQGAMTLDLTMKDDNGKLTGSVHSDSVPEPQAISDISRSGDGVVLRYTRELQGQAIPVKITITPPADKAADKARVEFELAGQIVLQGTATRK